ncbi:hypothetical protein HYR54_14885 [Candidatus Acetothermia bacterium]|nr:hypothetical protein [Candidatus Acetothermia bacterium]
MLDRILWTIVLWRLVKAGWPVLAILAFALWWPSLAGHSFFDLMFRTPGIVPMVFLVLIGYFVWRAIKQLMKE